MSSASADNVTINDGEEIQEVTTDEIAYKGLQGDNKARIFSEPWPAEDPPPTYASVFGIASAHGLYAAASPTALVIGRTNDVRKCIYDEEQKESVRNCEPIHTIPHNRLSQVAFLSNEAYLLVSEERASELLVYDTEKLASQQTEVAFRLSTNAPVRILAPNPNPVIERAPLCALINTDDQLLLVNFMTGGLISGSNGPILASNVSCVTWASKGSQFVAGRKDGTSLILDTTGKTLATIPKPSAVPSNCRVASISWVENNVFLIIWTPEHVPDDETPISEYYVVKTNTSRSEFTFHKIEPEPIFPGIFDRKVTPVHFYTSRLREYGNLKQLVILSANVAPDMKMLAKIAQSKHCPEEYITVVLKDDRSGASLPFMTDGLTDSTPIGVAIDLSDEKNIVAPILDDTDVHESDTPLPELAALTSEGILCVWAIIFADAIRSKTIYPAIAELQKTRHSLTSKDENNMQSITVTKPTTIVNTVTTPSTFSSMQAAAPNNIKPVTSPSSGDASNSPFSQQTAKSGFAGFGSGGGFGQTAAIGNSKTTSSWTSSGFTNTTTSQSSGSGFGQTGLGTPAQLSSTRSTFGQTGSFGVLSQSGTASPSFGQTGFGSQTPKPSFGQTGLGSQPAQGSAFGKNTSSSSPFTSTSNTSSGFGAFANQNGFGAAAKGDSPFAKATPIGGGFGQTANSNASPFGQASGSSAFGKPAGQSTFGTPSTSAPFGGLSTASPFGQGNKSGFKLESSFTKDATSKDDESVHEPSGGFGFGGLGGMLGGSTKPQSSPSKEEEMGEDDSSVTEVEDTKKSHITPPSTINQSKTTTTPHIESLFGTSKPQDKTPQSQQTVSTQWGFGNIPSTTPKDTPAPNKTMFGTKSTSEQSPAFVQKSEPSKSFETVSLPQTSSGVSELVDDDDDLDSDKSEDEVDEGDAPPAPLPPDPFSKPTYQAGDTSASSLNSTSREPDDATLPPDFIPANKNAAQSLRTENSEIPTEILSSGFSGSGEDITGDMSPIDDSEEDEEPEHKHVHQNAVGITPESSFGNPTDRSPQLPRTGGVFGNANIEQPKGRLFGEQLLSGPIFPPPKPEDGPESPSPQRKTARNILLQSPGRSSSAPVGPDLRRRKQESATLAAKAREEEAAREQARLEAERRAQKEAEALETRPLVDDEDEVLRQSLAQPLEPQEQLVPFLHKRAADLFDTSDSGRNDIPSQIEKLYRSINDMVITLGINARALSQFMLCQKDQEPAEHWPSVLASDTPSDAFTDTWFLSDIDRLSAGRDLLDRMLDDLTVKDIVEKLDACQNLLTGEVSDLKARITALRRSTQQRLQSGDAKNAPLSAEQSYLQQDLRKASAAAFTKLASVEENLTILRAKIAEVSPESTAGDGEFPGFPSATKKRPTVEAVMNTVQKMTNMAERKSADVDVLIAQFKQINVQSPQTSTQTGPRTPERQVKATGSARTPGSARSDAGSVYLTPSSEFSRSRGGSARGTPVKGVRVSAEDRERWRDKARRKKELAGLLKNVLSEKSKQIKV